MDYIHALKKLENVSHLAINIGSSSVSITSLLPIKYENVLKDSSPVLDNKKYRIQTAFIQTLNPDLPLIKIKELIQGQNVKEIKVFSDRKCDELTAIKDTNWIFDEKTKKEGILAAKGCNFLFQNVRDEAYVLDDESPGEVKFINQIHSLYPFILVTFGEEVIFIKVHSYDKYEFLGTSSLNMLSLLNLTKPLLTPNDVHHAISLAKLFATTSPETGDEIDPRQSSMSEDKEIQEMSTAFALVNMFCKNVGLMSTLYAKMHDISKVVFADSVSDDIFIKEIFSYSIKKLSKNNIEPLFLRHENFTSGIGAILSCSSEKEVKQFSWQENYCESTGMTFQFCYFDGIPCEQLTMDSLDDFQLISPLILLPDVYIPDTQNLHKDNAAREYWIKCIKDGVSLGIEKSLSATSDMNAANGLRHYKDIVLDRLDYLNANPQSYGELCMRILQDTMEHMKRETGLLTMYEKRKKDENKKALEELPGRLNYIDSLDHKERQEELIISMLAGNMFDWGAREVSQLMSQGKFGFIQAMEMLPVRPWLFDDLDKWTKRTKDSPYRLAMIFCDNCGYDLILGIIPFARDLLQWGTKVIICANKDPVLNDATYYDIIEILDKIKDICPIINESLDEKKLSVMEISKSTCCLDLSFIDAQIAQKMTEVDLLVIVGMGRVVHTNLHATFNCEALRVAVVKDRWFSQQLGGESFACICKYTQ